MKANSKTTANAKKMQLYVAAYNYALQLMSVGCEPTSAFKQAATDAGIVSADLEDLEASAHLRAFVWWAHEVLLTA